MLLKLLLLASLSLWGQTEGKPVSIGDFSGGLNTWKKSILLQDNESPNLQNVILDKTGGVTKRQGYTKRNTTAIGSSTDVNAVYQLEQSGGTKYCVAFSNQSGFYSSDACQTFTTFVTTLTLNNDVNCDAISDRLYCVNNQYNFFFTGSEDRPFTAVANLDYIRVHRNRCFSAGNSTNPSRLFYSNLGDCTTWTTSTDYVDIAPEDGDVITGIGEPFFDMLPIYKKFSTWALKGNTPSTFVLVNISKDTGAKNHRSIATYRNIQLFDSVGPNGGQPGIYGFNGIIVDEVSKKLRNEIEDLDTFRSASGIRIIDTKGDFDLGTFDSYTMSSSRDSGFMQSTYTSRTDTTSADFNQGTLVNVSTSVSGSAHVYISSDVVWINAGGELGTSDFTNFTRSGTDSDPWQNLTTGCASGVTGPKFGSNYFRSRGQFTSCGENLSVTLIHPDTGARIFNKLIPIVSGGVWTDHSIDISTYAISQFKIEFSLTNIIPTTEILTSTPIVKGNRIPLWVGSCHNAADSSCRASVDFDESIAIITSGTITRNFDTTISTPVWGLFEATVSSNANSGLTFQTAAAASCSGSFSAAATQTLGSEIVARGDDCLRYIGNYTLNSATNTPAALQSASFSAASTGTWTSQELFLSDDINATGWGLFQTESSLSGSEAQIAYSVRSATWSGGTTYAPWVVVSTGAAFSAAISTGAYVQVISTFTVGVASETSKLDSITFNWTEGSAAKSSSGKVFGNRYHYGAQSSGGSRNDVIYVYDTNGAWVKWTGVRPRHLNVVSQNFVMADSSTTSGGFIHKLYDSDSDNGGAIEAIYQTKDFSGTAIQNIKAVNKVYVIGSSSNTTVSMQVLANGGLTSKTYSVDFSTGATIKVVPKVIEPAVNGNTFSIRLSNNQPSKPWELLGLGIFYRDLGVMQAP